MGEIVKHTPGRPTKPQLKALKALSTGRVKGKFMPMTLTQLVALGYAKKELSVIGLHWMFTITDAGRSALAASEARP